MDFKIIKKIVFGLLMTMGMLNAQNNLVFNKALNFRLVPGNDGISLGQTATVPEGKVWKIESYQRDGAGGINVGFEIQDPEYGSAISYGSYSSTPIWLQEGTILKAPSDGIFFSVLEFNVVPTSSGTGSGTGGGGVSSDGLVFSQMINEAITTQPTTTSGTVIYSFQVPNGHVWKIRYMSIAYWNSSINQFQGTVLGGTIYITTNDEGPFIKQGPAVYSTNDYALLLKEGNYQVKYFHTNTNGGSGNRLYIEAIEYRIP